MSEIGLGVMILSPFAGALEGYLDGKKSNKKVIEHENSAKVRVLIAAALSTLFVQEAFYIVVYFLILLTGYWITFDLVFNLSRGKESIWYIGKTSKIDKIARKIFGLDGSLYLCFKILLIISLLTLFYINV